MTRDEVALQIFLKRIPSEPLNDTNRKWFESKIDEAYELADMIRPDLIPVVIEVKTPESEL